MFFPCEEVIKRFAPAVKAEAARRLSGDYSVTQIDIASALGVTQAAVSKHLAGIHSSTVRAAKASPVVKSVASRLAKGVASGNAIPLIPVDSVCAFCREMRRAGHSFGRVEGGLRINKKCDLK